MMSTFPYYGGRFNQLQKIMEVLSEHKEAFDVVVDVFGGSGKVLLNIPEEWRKVKVYNDIHKDLYTTFKVLQDSRKRAKLTRKLHLAFPHETIFQELKESDPTDDVEIVFKTIYLHTFSFAGAGMNFKRFYRKANVPPLRTESFIHIKKWVVENMDFRKILNRYNKERVLLYLDPPYLRGGQIYQYNFTMDQFQDLNDMRDKHQGSYLLNLSMTDPEMIGIFGQPDLVTEHNRPTTLKQPGRSNEWECGYWWKFNK